MEQVFQTLHSEVRNKIAIFLADKELGYTLIRVFVPWVNSCNSEFFLAIQIVTRTQ